jgi:putative membrane protein
MSSSPSTTIFKEHPMSNPTLILALAVALGGWCSIYASDSTLASTSTPTVAKADQDFVENASQGGLFEVRSSEIAVKRAVGGQEQQFAQMMIDDHGKANRILASLAAKKSIDAASMPDKKHQELLEKLGSAADRDFAKQYVEMQLRAHKDAIDLFTTESKDGKDVDLRSFASDTLPTLQAHLASIKVLADKY